MTNQFTNGFQRDFINRNNSFEKEDLSKVNNINIKILNSQPDKYTSLFSNDCPKKAEEENEFDDFYIYKNNNSTTSYYYQTAI